MVVTVGFASSFLPKMPKNPFRLGFLGCSCTLFCAITGTGMTEEEQQRVFGAFERLPNAAAKDGFGLGLSIFQRI